MLEVDGEVAWASSIDVLRVQSPGAPIQIAWLLIGQLSARVLWAGYNGTSSIPSRIQAGEPQLPHALSKELIEGASFQLLALTP